MDNTNTPLATDVAPPKRKKLLIALFTSGIIVPFVFAGFTYTYLRGGTPRIAEEEIIIPTLALKENRDSAIDFAARLIGMQDETEVHYFEKSESGTGFTAIAHTHTLFNCPDDTAPGVSVSVAHGDQKSFSEKRSWGYEYSGNENANKAAGKTGLALFDGRFWLSTGELAVTGDRFRSLDTPNMTMVAGKRYYLQTEIDLRVSCLDTDNDNLNNGREDLNSDQAVDPGETDWQDADTDDDGVIDGYEVALSINPLDTDSDNDDILDGTELSETSASVTSDTDLTVFVPDADPTTDTNALESDTDGGGAPDGEEDANQNGRIDAGETDPNDPSDDAPYTAVTLDITQTNTGGTKSVTSGDQDVTLLSFQARAIGGDVHLKQLKFAPRDGSALNAYNYSLLDDTDGDMVVDSLVQLIPNFSNPQLTFNLGGDYILPQDTAVTFELQADIKHPADDMLQFEFRSFADRYVMAERASDNVELWGIETNGSCISTCNIFVTTGPAMVIDIVLPPLLCGNGLIQGDEECDDDNNIADDGCSPICEVEDGWECSGEPSECSVIIPDPNDIGNLSVAERALGLTDTAVTNEQNVTGFRFEAMASETKDIFLSHVAIKADEGSLADAEDYTLWVDTNNDAVVDTILESGKSCAGVCDGDPNQEDDSVDFDNLAGGGYSIPAGETVVFEVHFDVVNALSHSPGTLSIGFDDNNGNAEAFSFLGAEHADDGSVLRCISVDGVLSTDVGCSATTIQIPVATTASKVFTLKENGSLYMARSTVPVRPRQLLAGAEGEAVLRFDFRSEDEAVEVTRLVITDVSGNDPGNTIKQLNLYRDGGGSTAFAVASSDVCGTIDAELPANSFCAVMESQQLLVPNNESVEVFVRPLLKTDEEGAVSDFTGVTQFSVEIPTAFATTVAARGFASGKSLAVNDGDTTEEGEIFVGTYVAGPSAAITGNANDTVLAKIVTIENTNPAADGTQVPVGINKAIGKFKFTAATNVNTLNGRNIATISGLVFNVDATNVTFDASEFDLYNENDQQQVISCIAYDSAGTSINASAVGSGSMLVKCARSDNTSVDLEMDSGDSVTLVLEGDITDEQIDGFQESLLQVSLTNFADRSMAGTFGTGNGNSHIRWTDTSPELSTPVYFQWIENPETIIRSTQYQTDPSLPI